MLRRAITTAIAAAALGVTTAPAAARRPHPAFRCTTQTGQTILADNQARIYATGRGTYAGCGYRARHAITLGQIGSAGEAVVNLNNVVLVGSVAALNQATQTAQAGYTFTVSVFDLRRGRLLRSLPTGAPSASQLAFSSLACYRYCAGVGPTTALVLKTDGAAAWIVNDNQAPDTPTYKVVRADAAGSPTVVAAGADIDPTSLALGRSTLYWQQAGATHSSQLV